MTFKLGNVLRAFGNYYYLVIALKFYLLLLFNERITNVLQYGMTSDVEWIIKLRNKAIL